VRRLALPALLLLAACKPLPELPGASLPYAQTEEGHTLVYVDPQLQGAEQVDQRLQVRVAKVTHEADGGLVVEKEAIRGLQRPFKSVVRVARGGVALLDDKGKAAIQILPEGFPDRAASWATQGTTYQVVGRGAWSGAALLPRTSDPVGVWVESRPPRGPRSRSLFLKGFGEVETLEARPDGSWVCVNRLQQQSFLDVPSDPNSAK
jgi:hypothetical protein